jgi:pyruvate,water dikinase
MYIRWFETLRAQDTSLVGGKNASLGEMLSALKQRGIRVPDGFATTAEAYWDFLKEAAPAIEEALRALKQQKEPLQKVGARIRSLILNIPFSERLADELKQAYAELSRRYGVRHADVAVRSSATTEDLPEASFAGQQETYLHVRGEDALLTSCRKCFASLFTDRAISYREAKGFAHAHAALSIGVQKMVRADKAGSGVLFTLDMESGFRKVIVINAAWGLGENVVQGAVIPDEYIVFKPLLGLPGVVPIIEKALGDKEKRLVYAGSSTKNRSTPHAARRRFVLSDDEILTLASWGAIIEEHYGTPMDIEWAKDGFTQELFIVQARPETVQSLKKTSVLKAYTLKERGVPLLEGLAVGEAIASGKAQIIKRVEEIGTFVPGSILITSMTSPDWVPIMKQACGIITDEGGRTSHAAIVSRELSLPAIVGTGCATEALRDNQEITLSCAEGDRGRVYAGLLAYDTTEVDLSDLPAVQTAIMLNIGSPSEAFRWWNLPCRGIGLARMEFIINNLIKIHPMALCHPERVHDARALRSIERLTRGYPDKREYFIDKLARGIARIAASQHPHPVIVRMSDFKTNEYANLIGGRAFEPAEENPMLGFRGASRYYSPRYREGFDLECHAIRRVRDVLGLSNVRVMIPFCRTVEEGEKVLRVLEENGLKRGEKGLEIYVMCEIPSNILLAERFAQLFDGFSIGSNDLTQLILGVDRDSASLAHLFDERNEAVKRAIADLIQTARRLHCKVGICGQAPSDYPDFAEFLVRLGINSLSLNPDSVISTIRRISGIEKELGKQIA